MEDSMDIDIDLGDDMDYGQPAALTEAALTPQPVLQSQSTDDIPEAYKDDFDADFPAKEKIFISGLDGVAQPLIVQFLDEHIPNKKFRRLEWIDDSSANIIFYKAEDAADALIHLSISQDTLPASLQSRPAKPFAARPELRFAIRQARVGDKKKPGAKDRSAFYLFNPDWDPEQRKRDGRQGRGGRGARSNGAGRGRPQTEKLFTEDMYDDVTPAQVEEGILARRMSTASLSSGSQEQFRKKRRYGDGGEDLFKGRRDQGRLNDRSRSPTKDDVDGRYGFTGDQPTRRTARHRSRTPPIKRRPAANSRAANSNQDLFPDRVSAASNTPLSSVQPDRSHSSKRSRELFPHKTGHSNHRRSDALDREDLAGVVAPGGSLADRISGVPSASVARGRGTVKEPGDFAIRGAGDMQPGFSIRGASKELNPKVKELFPDRASSTTNIGKELFPESRGRGLQRRRAEDFD